MKTKEGLRKAAIAAALSMTALSSTGCLAAGALAAASIITANVGAAGAGVGFGAGQLGGDVSHMVCLKGNVGPGKEAGGNPIYITDKTLGYLEALTPAQAQQLFGEDAPHLGFVKDQMGYVLKSQIEDALKAGMPLSDDRPGLAPAPGSLDLSNPQKLRETARYAGSYMIPSAKFDARLLSLDPAQGGLPAARAPEAVLRAAIGQHPIATKIADEGSEINLAYLSATISSFNMVEMANQIKDPARAEELRNAGIILGSAVMETDDKPHAKLDKWTNIFRADSVRVNALGATRAMPGGGVEAADDQIAGTVPIVRIEYAQVGGQPGKHPYPGTFDVKQVRTLWKDASHTYRNTNNQEFGERYGICGPKPKEAVAYVVGPALHGMWPGISAATPTPPTQAPQR